MVFVYHSVSFTLRSHPLALLRPQLQRLEHLKLKTSKPLRGLPDQREVQTCGIVTTKQLHETAKGVIFISLQDGEGEIQVIDYRYIWERPHQRPLVLHSRLMAVKGRWQREGATLLRAAWKT